MAILTRSMGSATEVCPACHEQDPSGGQGRPPRRGSARSSSSPQRVARPERHGDGDQGHPERGAHETSRRGRVPRGPAGSPPDGTSPASASANRGRGAIRSQSRECHPPRAREPGERDFECLPGDEDGRMVGRGDHAEDAGRNEAKPRPRDRRRARAQAQDRAPVPRSLALGARQASARLVAPPLAVPVADQRGKEDVDGGASRPGRGSTRRVEACGFGGATTLIYKYEAPPPTLFSSGRRRCGVLRPPPPPPPRASLCLLSLAPFFFSPPRAGPLPPGSLGGLRAGGLRGHGARGMEMAPTSGRRTNPSGSKTPAAIGQGEAVVADGPGEVLVHLALCAAADRDRGGDVERVGAHEHDVGGLDGDVGAGADGDARRRPGRARARR